jgi:hypothetical protein
LNCKDKDRLLLEFNQRVREWSQAVNRLTKQVGVGHGTYMRLLSEINVARVKTNHAKAAYEKHSAEHGC